LSGLLALVLPWSSVSAGILSNKYYGWEKGSWQVAVWLGTESLPLEAILILVTVGLGIYLAQAPLTGWPTPSWPYLSAAPGVALAVLGLLNYRFIDHGIGLLKTEGAALNLVVHGSVGIGVFVLVLAGVTSAASAVIDDRSRRRRATSD